jgi:hypothetical protein
MNTEILNAALNEAIRSLIVMRESGAVSYSTIDEALLKLREARAYLNNGLVAKVNQT